MVIGNTLFTAIVSLLIALGISGSPGFIDHILNIDANHWSAGKDSAPFTNYFVSS